MGKITYTDKVALNEDPSIADINKCKADDMNEIKNVVNTLLNDVPSSTAPQNPVLNDLWIDTNDDEYLAQIDETISTTSTNAVQNQAITNYVNGDVLYSDTTGSATNITLSKNPLNYKRIVIYGGDGNRGLVNATVYPNENANFQIQIDEVGGSWFSIIALRGTLTSTGITVNDEFLYNGSSYGTSTDLKIKKVIGYNY